MKEKGDDRIAIQDIATPSRPPEKGRREYKHVVVTYISKNLSFKIVCRAKIPVVVALRCSPVRKPHVVNYAIRPRQFRKRSLLFTLSKEHTISLEDIVIEHCATLYDMQLAFQIFVL